MGKRLNKEEKQQLLACESTIGGYERGFLDVGRALALVRDNRLYREGWPDFDGYIAGRWDMSRQHAYRLMDAAEVVDDLIKYKGEPAHDGDDLRPMGHILSPMGDILPINERQARPLAPLDGDQRREAWRMVLEAASGGRITSSLISNVVDQYLESIGEGAPAPRPAEEDLFARLSGLRRKLKRLETKPEYFDYCRKVQAELSRLCREVEETFSEAWKQYLKAS